LAVGVTSGPRSAAHPYTGPSTGIHLTGQGLRYSAGVGYRF